LDFAGFVDFLDDRRRVFDAPTDGVDDQFEVGGAELEVELLERGIHAVKKDVVVF
jgi:hypothetical protein